MPAMTLAKLREQVFTLFLALADVELVVYLVIIVSLYDPRYFYYFTWLGDL